MVTVLVTGAESFAGRWLLPALGVDGREVRYGSSASLEGCAAAYYLGDGDVAAAERFAAAAAAAAVGRIIYLGGIVPSDPLRASAALRRRLEVGAVLRSGSVPAIELRAGLIVGQGNPSWEVVHALASRLPVMLLSSWLDGIGQPVAIRDVVAALVGALRVPIERSIVWDLPGPQPMTAREILEETAAALGRPRPPEIPVPVSSPWLSARWAQLVTRARWEVVRDLIHDLGAGQRAHDDGFWELIGHPLRQDFPAAARAAVVDKRLRG